LSLRFNHVLVPSTDVARSIEFYRRLGLEPIVVEDAADGAPRYARLRTPDGETTLSLERAPVVAAQPAAVLYFECADLDERVRALEAAGYAFTEPPRTKPWLWREAELLDPDRRRIRLYQAGSYRLDPPWRLPGTHGAPEAGPPAFLAARNRGYADGPIPSARDDEIAAFLEETIAGGRDAREAAAASLGSQHTATLLAFAERTATRAVRERQGRRALLGLCAVGLAWRGAADVRAAIPVLGLLHDAAARAGADPAALFEEASSLAPDDVAPVFRDFLTRTDLDGIAAEMGYREGQDRDGFRYRRLWGAGQLDDTEGA
jgi:catechol 2,3-dioxygenase-like lactoylglutathione lyase family enzyme